MLVGLSALFLSLSPALATSSAETCMRTKSWEAQELGLKLRAMESSELQQGEIQTLKTGLFSTRSYVIKTCADKGVQQLDLVVYDAQGNELARSAAEAGRTPELKLELGRAASVYIVGQVRQAAAGSHGVSVGLFYK